MSFKISYHTPASDRISVIITGKAADALDLIAQLETLGNRFAYVQSATGQTMDLATLQAEADLDPSAPF